MARVNIKEFYDKLGIEYTEDLKEVRKAYSKKIAYCHPEENPEEWQEVHFAYVSIKEFLDAKKEAEKKEKELQQQAEQIHQEQPVTNPISNNEAELINQILDSAPVEEQAKEDYEKFKPIVNKLKGLATSRKIINGKTVVYLNKFNELRENSLYEDAMTYSIFVSKLASVFSTSILEPGIPELAEQDITKAKEKAFNNIRHVSYHVLEDSLYKNPISPSEFKKAMKVERKNDKRRMAAYSREYNKSNNRSYSSSADDAKWFRLVILVIILLLRLVSCAR